MSNIYELKYFKYKNKYLKLKEELYGGLPNLKKRVMKVVDTVMIEDKGKKKKKKEDIKKFISVVDTVMIKEEEKKENIKKFIDESIKSINSINIDDGILYEINGEKYILKLPKDFKIDNDNKNRVDME